MFSYCLQLPCPLLQASVYVWDVKAKKDPRDSGPSFFFLFFKNLFRAARTACGSSHLGVKLELQLPAYTSTTAMWDLSCICDLYHSSRQRWIPNRLSEARNQAHVLVGFVTAEALQELLALPFSRALENSLPST